MTAPVLVLAVGNPSRGDDALGPAFLDRVEAALSGELRAGRLELLADFQLQVEHALDLVGRAQVVFVDASLRAPAPFSYRPVVARDDSTFTSHALSPAAVLEAYGRVEPGPAPPCFVLAIHGEAFELGAPLSAGAQANLAQAVEFFLARWPREGCSAAAQP